MRLSMESAVGTRGGPAPDAHGPNSGETSEIAGSCEQPGWLVQAGFWRIPDLVVKGRRFQSCQLDRRSRRSETSGSSRFVRERSG